MLVIKIPLKAITEIFHTIFDFFETAAVCDCFIYIPPQYIPMSELTGLVYPIRFLITVKMRKRYYRLSVFLANCIGDLPKLHVITDMVFKLSARLKRNGIYHEMIVNVIRIKMGSNDNFISIAPHSTGSFQSYFVCFFGCNFSRHKTLIPVIGNIAAELSVPPLGCHHTLIGSLLRTVDTWHIHCLVGLLVVLHVTERRPQVLVQELFIGGFVRVLRIIDYFL